MPGYNKWSISQDIPLFLEIASADGSGATGASPSVAVKRYKSINNGFLDGYYWDGVGFSASISFLPLAEVDSTNYPGLYTYCFSQSLVQTETVYNVYYKNTTVPVGFTQETHIVAITGSAGDVRLYESEPE
jgi:hypothetical protein